MAQNGNNEELNDFINAVRRVYAPTEIIMFGSRARGDHWKPSDYDFIVVSSRFAGVNWHDRMVAVQRLWDRPEDMDVLPYTPEEFEKKKNELGIVRVAVREGIRLIN
jgi:predicted nucleotidyltransferase